MQLKQYEIVQNKDMLNVDLQQIFMDHKTIKQWAYILHDKDDTRPHYHIYVNFGNSGVPHEMVAGWFQVPPNLVNKVKGRKADVLLYLIHGQESQKHKYQYSPEEVVSNFSWEIEVQQAKIIGDFKNYSYAQQLQYIDTLPISEKPRYYNQLERLWKMHCQLMTLNTDRKVDVIFVCGRAGTGKTYYAKKLFTSLNYDFCVSSSANDPMQDYMGQKGFLFDDLRDEVFDLPDLLKVLDNNTGSSTRSRFTNKVFNGDLIIITSSVPLVYWYKKYLHNKTDTLDQLYRRIGSYVEVKEKEILVFSGVDMNGKPCGDCRRYYNEVYDLKKSAITTKTNVTSVFDKICKPVEDFVSDDVVLQQVLDIDDEIF